MLDLSVSSPSAQSSLYTMSQASSSCWIPTIVALCHPPVLCLAVWCFHLCVRIAERGRGVKRVSERREKRRETENEVLKIGDPIRAELQKNKTQTVQNVCPYLPLPHQPHSQSYFWTGAAARKSAREVQELSGLSWPWPWVSGVCVPPSLRCSRLHLLCGPLALLLLPVMPVPGMTQRTAQYKFSRLCQSAPCSFTLPGARVACTC